MKGDVDTHPSFNGRKHLFSTYWAVHMYEQIPLQQLVGNLILHHRFLLFAKDFFHLSERVNRVT